MSKLTEFSDYTAMLRRMVRAYGRRAGKPAVGVSGVEDLADVLAMQAELDRAYLVMVDTLREQGMSWADIARGIGQTRQGAQQHYQRLAARLGHTPAGVAGAVIAAVTA